MPQIAPEIVHYAISTIFESPGQDPNRLKEDLTAEKAAAATMFQEYLPQNATELALAMRAVIAHHTSGACVRRAMIPEMPLVLQTRLIAQGIALSRLSSQLMKAFRAEPGKILEPMPGRAPAKAAVQVNPMQSGEAPTPERPTAAAERPVMDPQQALRAILAATGRGG